MKKLFGVFLILFMAVLCLEAREKTMQIGKYAWYTEQNTFEEILAIAKKEKKPVFAVYSATWCKPCKVVKEETFESDGFGKVAEEVVLLYVEQTDPKSKEYLDRHRISFYPTFKLFNIEGKQYETPGPDRTVEGFYKWVMDGKAGKYRFFQPVGKTMQIGDVTWYTQESRWEDILEIAGKANKPILVFVTRKRSRGLKIKNEILPAAPALEAAKEVIPLYVNSRERSGRALKNKLRVMKYPTFLMVSKDGVELDLKNGIESAEALLQWVKDVKAGKSIVGMKAQLKKDPENLELLMKIVRKGKRLELDEQIAFTRRAIALKPDINDPSARVAYEYLLFMHAGKIRTLKERVFQESYGKRHHKEFAKILDAYYPDKLEHIMTLPGGYRQIFEWYGASGESAEGLKYVDDYLKNEAPKLEFRRKLMTFPTIFPVLLKGGRETQAVELLNQLGKEAEETGDARMKQMFSFINSTFLEIFIDFYAEKGDLERGKAFAERQLAAYTKSFMGGRIGLRKEQLAMKYLFYAPELIAEYEGKLKTAKESRRYRWQFPLAAIYARQGDKQKARKYLDELYAIFSKEKDGAKRKKGASLLSHLARIAYDGNIVDAKILAIAEEAVLLEESEAGFDVLSDIHAKLGNYKSAISCAEKAISLTDKIYKIPRYRFKIEMWQKK